jgi:hypothetical protein
MRKYLAWLNSSQTKIVTALARALCGDHRITKNREEDRNKARFEKKEERKDKVRSHTDK